MEYEIIIGLEIHAQLKTASKIFCGCSTAYGARPNTQTCPVCLGMPGALPLLNRKAVEYAIRLALALNCRVAERSWFVRKNYFYPDLPKGYQISQYADAVAFGGHLTIHIDGGRRRVGVERIQLEEDAGKSLHHEEGSSQTDTWIDLNRCGVPLVEIVTRPDLRSPREAFLFLVVLRQLLQYLDICDGDMEKGSLRCDVNVSLRAPGSSSMGTRTEAKNLNSFRSVERTLHFEIERQRKVIEQGGAVSQETLQWDERAQAAVSVRRKEEAHDYRYFPEPDLVSVRIAPQWIEEIRRELPELPWEKKERFATDYNLPVEDAQVLTSTKELADYYESCLGLYRRPKEVSNWVRGPVLRELKERNIPPDAFLVTPKRLAELLQLVKDGAISNTLAKIIFNEMAGHGRKPAEIVAETGLAQITHLAEIESVVDAVVESHVQLVEDYRKGHTKVFGYLVGQVMKATEGRANPKVVNDVLKKRLGG